MNLTQLCKLSWYSTLPNLMAVSDPSPHEYFMVLFLEILAGRLANTFGFLGKFIWRDVSQIHLASWQKQTDLLSHLIRAAGHAPGK